MAKKKKKEIDNEGVESIETTALKPDDLLEIIGNKDRHFLMPSGRHIFLAFGLPKDALELYKSGRFPYIGLKQGAEVLFEGESQETIEKLIKQAPRPEDVKILEKVKQ